MWKCSKVGSLGKGSQFCTKPSDKDHQFIWNVVDVLPSGVRVCRNYETKQLREFSPACFAWRYFLCF